MVHRGLRSGAGRDFCRVVLWQTAKAGGSSRDIPLQYVGLLAVGEAGDRQRRTEEGRESWRKSWLQLPRDQPIGSQLKEFGHSLQVLGMCCGTFLVLCAVGRYVALPQ